MILNKLISRCVIGILLFIGIVITNTVSSSPMEIQGACDWLYDTVLASCLEPVTENCNDGVTGLPHSSSIIPTDDVDVKFASRVLDSNKFNKLCKQVCLSKRIPSRKSFGKKFCGNR